MTTRPLPRVPAATRLAVLLLGLALLVGCTPSSAAIPGADGASPASSLTSGDATGGTTPGDATGGTSLTSGDTTGGTGDPTSGTDPSSGTAALVPFVPVATFRSGVSSVGWTALDQALQGGGSWRALELVAAEADAILAALRRSRPADPTRLILAPSATALAADLKAHPDRLGFVRASAVTPRLRALAWGSRTLFGVDRLRSLDTWPLRAALPPDASAFDSGALWTMWAGGDLGVDRTMTYVIRTLGKGVDWPFSGGRARISGTTCCSSFGWPLPVIVPTGGAGAVRHLISSADLAIANLEGPMPDRFTFHTSGTVFTGDPAYLAGIQRAGIDVLTLANNHIGDAGRTGVVQTVRNLDRYGLRHVGAGATLAAARKPVVVEMTGATVAILSYDSIVRAYAATATSPGSAPLIESLMRADIAAARAAGAELVVVWPHWGVEYTHGPSDFQRRMGRIAIDAGADLVIGNHPHWVGAIETYRGKPIWYALGNYTFDQRWSEPTLEGISLELTFRGRTLVQARMHPHVNILAVQPNLLDPAGSGRRVLDPVFAASPNLAW